MYETFSEVERGHIDGLYDHRVQRLTCQGPCGRALPLNHFSMCDLNAHHNLCNDCVVQSYEKRKKLLYMAVDRSDWMHQAQCIGEDPESFHPQWPDDRYKKVCPGCPVAEQCAKRGADTHASGVWGGMLYVIPGRGPQRGQRVARPDGPIPRGRPLTSGDARVKRKGCGVPGPAPMTTPEQDAQALRMGQEGVSMTELALIFGVARSTIGKMKARARAAAERG